jgi:cleavage stimulation factor subunit 2
MNLVEYQLLGSIVEQAAQPQAPPPQQAQQFQPYGVPGQISTPPVAGTPFAPPPAQPAPQMHGQEELLQQVLSMPQATIDALPPMERSQIMLLRQQLMQGGMR